MDMQITFDTGFSNLGNKILENHKKKREGEEQLQESVYHQYLRKKKEKKVLKKSE